MPKSFSQRFLNPVRSYLDVTVSQPCEDIKQVYRETAPNRRPRQKSASLLQIAKRQRQMVSPDGPVRPAVSVTQVHRISMFNGINHIFVD